MNFCKQNGNKRPKVIELSLVPSTPIEKQQSFRALKASISEGGMCKMFISCFREFKHAKN